MKTINYKCETGDWVMVSKQQTMGFQTEVKQMLHLVVHSLYSNKEIFLAL